MKIIDVKRKIALVPYLKCVQGRWNKYAKRFNHNIFYLKFKDTYKNGD